MSINSKITRIERDLSLVQTAATQKSRGVAPDCICFPKECQPGFDSDDELRAAALLCPIHGKRFDDRFLIYQPAWLRRQFEISEQYRKAMAASGVTKEEPSRPRHFRRQIEFV